MTRRPVGRRLLVGAAVALPLLVGLPAAGLALFLATVDPALMRARVTSEVERATGRQLGFATLRVRLHPGLIPDLALEATDVALANPAGFSRPAMVTAGRVEARLALLPLLARRLVVNTLTLDHADLRLERGVSGPPNWIFDPAHASAALPRPAQPGQSGSGARWRGLTVLGLTLGDGSLSWRIADHAGSVALTGVRLREVNASSTIFVDVKAVAGGESLALSGRLGGQNHLWNAADRTPWPVDLKLDAPAGQVALSGFLTRPRIVRGFDVTIAAQGPDLGRLGELWPGWRAPRLRDAVLATRLVDQPDGLDMPLLSLTAGASDLSATAPGLRLDRLSVAASNIDGTNGNVANHIAAEGQYAGQALKLAATLGPVGRLFGRGQVAARGPITLDATATAAGATLQVRGKVAPAGDWSGTAAVLHASIPDLALLSPFAGRTLPRLHGLTLDAAIGSAGGVLTLSNAHLSLPEADVTAEGAARLSGRPRYTGSLRIARLDLDALRAASAPPAEPASVGALPAPAALGSGVARGGFLIPDTPDLPVRRLAGFDADIAVAADRVRWRGVAIGAAQLRLRLDHGRLDADPVAVRVAGVGVTGVSVTGSASIDAARMPPVFAVVLNAPGLDAATLSALLADPGAATGRVDLDASLGGSGANPRAIAASLDGHLGLALINGTVANALLGQAVDRFTPAATLGLKLPSSGLSDVACFATRLEARQGVAVIRAFMLDTRRLRLAAAGAIDLGDETLALRLRPYVRLGPTGLVLPSHADGAWRSPRLGLEPSGGAASAASMMRGVAAGLGSTSGTGSGGGAPSFAATLAELAAPADALLSTADSGDCGPALAAARDPSAAPPPVRAAAAAPPPSRRQKAIDLLRRLFK